MTARPARTTLVAGLFAAVLLVWGWTGRVDRIDKALPYCQHPDEHAWVGHALRIARTGDLSPRRFTKPSLMVYLNAVGFRVALLSAESAELPSKCYPYFEHADLIRPVRLIYAGLSLVTVVLASLAVRKLMQGWAMARAGWPWLSTPDGAALLTVALALSSPNYLRYSCWYLNVDILGCLTAMAVITFSLSYPRDGSARRFAILSGVLSGLCIGTKYNLFPIAAPPLLFLVFFHRPKLRALLPLFFAVIVLGFLLTTPYALLRAPKFFAQVAGEVHHYATGDGSPQRSPGLEMFLAYGGAVARNFSPVVLVLAALGLIEAVRRDPRTAAIAFSYPLLLWLFMAVQRTFFARNLLVLELVVPMLAVLGAASLADRAGRALGRLRPWQSVSIELALGLCLALTLNATWPREATADAFERHPESRNLAVQWLEKNVPAGSKILVARELDMDVRPLKGTYRVRKYDAFRASASWLKRRHRGAFALVPLVESGGKNMPLDAGKVVFRAGKNRIRKLEQSEDKEQKVLAGDPKLVIVRL